MTRSPPRGRAVTVTCKRVRALKRVGRVRFTQHTDNLMLPLFQGPGVVWSQSQENAVWVFWGRMQLWPT